MLKGTNLQYAKAHNVRIVLETIRLFGPLSRMDIARRTELTAQTVSNITRQLIQDELILETQRQQEGRGAPSTPLTLNPDGAFSIGFDLDRDHLTGVLVDLVGNVRQRSSQELHYPSPEEAMDLIVQTAKDMIGRERIPITRIWGIGVGVPGPLGISDGTVTNAHPSAFPGWSDVPVVDILRKRLNLPVYLENNATAAAVGEKWYGGGRHLRTFFYVYFGAGLGGGLVVNGQPFEGSTGNAGEIGYLPSAIKPAEATEFERPHLGIFFNLPLLYRKLSESGRPVRRAGELEEVLAESDPVLLEWLETGARQLAPVILSIEYLLDPQAIFFGGRLPEPLILALLDRLQQELPSLRVEGKPGTAALEVATAGADAAALGVATLPLYTSLAPAPGLLMKRAAGQKAPRLTSR